MKLTTEERITLIAFLFTYDCPLLLKYIFIYLKYKIYIGVMNLLYWIFHGEKLWKTDELERRGK